MNSIGENFTNGIDVMNVNSEKFHKMNLLRLIPLLVVVTCQLDPFDPPECP